MFILRFLRTLLKIFHCSLYTASRLFTTGIFISGDICHLSNSPLKPMDFQQSLPQRQDHSGNPPPKAIPILPQHRKQPAPALALFPLPNCRSLLLISTLNSPTFYKLHISQAVKSLDIRGFSLLFLLIYSFV